MRNFTILNWNIGGAKYLEKNEHDRGVFRENLNKELSSLIKRHNFPKVITLQEIVRYVQPNKKGKSEDIIDIKYFDDYNYYPFILFDTKEYSAQFKWANVKEKGGWPPDTYFGQGNAFLIHNKMAFSPLFSLKDGTLPEEQNISLIEKVILQSGIYLGDRNTEPRAGLVCHFIIPPLLNPKNPKDVREKPFDIFVVNLHLTTLRHEREGIALIDEEAVRIRTNQLEVIFNGIISQYNYWKQKKYSFRGETVTPGPGEIIDRYPPIWILTGDFNFTPASDEYEILKKRNFADACPIKAQGTKAKGMGRAATLTLDYIFVGPKFTSFDLTVLRAKIERNPPPDYQVTVSDHYPLYATIPLATPELEE